MAAKSIIVMGVCASGKSSIAARLAAVIKAKFIDGDDLHPKANIIKMAKGEALNDTDRAPWLERIRDAAFSIEQKNETAVIVCSALKQSYREQIREGNNHVVFLYLEGSYQLILKRIQARHGHFMKADMLDSQFATLEEPSNEPDVITVNIDNSIEAIVQQALKALTELESS
ncbi:MULTISPECIES: gluconokinase [unclassified Shewanella]|uniref:gluconokinase n=1 Tax=unclassified Shewanella TaxID=196818 RepID=UPI000C85FA60|nr:MULTISPECIES: gluconokinase [unclassified Shewanella]MDO6774426.1 gluconokinase [Shewanella sp. 3_MG-2023]PMG45926.1 gluconate kinase [Shewanella sp. 10N.286.52.B9]PMH85081.1 gluconate kinase [Shewanella sp. 10N.286.48.B5]